MVMRAYGKYKYVEGSRAATPALVGTWVYDLRSQFVGADSGRRLAIGSDLLVGSVSVNDQS